MSIESEIYTRLTTHAGLSVLVSTRVYPWTEVPQEPTYPFVTYHLVSAPRPHAMGVDAGVVMAMFQFNVWAEDDEVGTAGYDAMLAAKDQLRLALQRWRTTSGTIVQDTFLENESDDSDPVLESHGRRFDARIIYEE